MSDTFTSVLDATITLNGNGLSSTQEVSPAIVNTSAFGPYRVSATLAPGSSTNIFTSATFAAGSWAVLTFSTATGGQIYLNGANQGAGAGYQVGTGTGNPTVLPIGIQTNLWIYNGASNSVDVQLEVY